MSRQDTQVEFRNYCIRFLNIITPIGGGNAGHGITYTNLGGDLFNSLIGIEGNWNGFNLYAKPFINALREYVFLENDLAHTKFIKKAENIWRYVVNLENLNSDIKYFLWDNALGTEQLKKIANTYIYAKKEVQNG